MAETRQIFGGEPKKSVWFQPCFTSLLYRRLNLSGDTAMKHGQCMTDETLTGYLEDVLEPVVKAACEVHLIACDRCRGHLAMYMRVLRTETTPDEDGALKAISDA